MNASRFDLTCSRSAFQPLRLNEHVEVLLNVEKGGKKKIIYHVVAAGNNVDQVYRFLSPSPPSRPPLWLARQLYDGFQANATVL